jgi:hypothetical protein
MLERYQERIMFEGIGETVVALAALAWLFSLVPLRNKLLRPTASWRSLAFFLAYVLAGAVAIATAMLMLLGPSRPS